MVPQFSVDCQGVSRSVGLPACCSAWDGSSRASWVWTPTGRARFSLQIFFLWSLSVVLIAVGLFRAVGGASRRCFFGGVLDRSLLTFPRVALDLWFTFA